MKFAKILRDRSCNTSQRGGGGGGGGGGQKSVVYKNFTPPQKKYIR